MLVDELTLITTIVNVVLSTANAVMLAINLFLVNRRTKESLQLSERDQRIKIFERAGLLLELLVISNQEEIKVTNTGEMSIDKLSLNVSVLKSGEKLLDRKYTSKSSLMKAQDFTVPLHKVLRKTFEERKLMSYRKDEVGFEFDPDVGYEVPIIIGKWWATEDFSLEITVNTSYEVMGEEKTQQNTFKADYEVDAEFYREPFIFIDGDNFAIKIQKIHGEWQ
jgi:hypothetical protein